MLHHKINNKKLKSWQGTTTLNRSIKWKICSIFSPITFYHEIFHMETQTKICHYIIQDWQLEIIGLTQVWLFPSDHLFVYIPLSKHWNDLFIINLNNWYNSKKIIDYQKLLITTTWWFETRNILVWTITMCCSIGSTVSVQVHIIVVQLTNDAVCQNWARPFQFKCEKCRTPRLDASIWWLL